MRLAGMSLRPPKKLALIAASSTDCSSLKRTTESDESRTLKAEGRKRKAEARKQTAEGGPARRLSPFRLRPGRSHFNPRQFKHFPPATSGSSPSDIEMRLSATHPTHRPRGIQITDN